MKNFLIAVLMVAAMGCAERAHTAEFSEEKGFEYWTSFIQREGNSVAARMGTGSPGGSEPDFLGISYSPGYCERGRMVLAIPREEGRIYEADVAIPGRIRVDRKEIVNISYRGHAQGRYFVFVIEGVGEEYLLQGHIVHLRVGMSQGKSRYHRFSLYGMAAAYERTRARCFALTPAEAYFPPEGSSE